MTKLRELAPKPTAEQFTRLALAIDSSAEVISTRRLTGGISCRMDVLKFKTSLNQEREVVVRQYGPWHKDDDPHPATIEAAVLELLGKNEIAAPTLILDKPATKIMGTRTVVTSYIDGRPKMITSDLEDWSRQLVTAIMRVHAVPLTPKIRKVLPPLYTGFERLFTRSEPTENIAKHPLGPQLWQHLRDRWPEVSKTVDHLVHADYWPGNTLWKDDQLVAIIDWEEPRLGVPVWDIAIIVQDAACFAIDIEDYVLSHYRRTSGTNLKDFDFWRRCIALVQMPDPGVWVDGYRALGGSEITADEVRANHTRVVKQFLYSE
jgi:aminoglycoside phosphotransferase (APT) family kinase protein